MLVWEDELGTRESGDQPLEAYLELVRPMVLFRSAGEIVEALRERYPNLDENPELKAAIGDVWPRMPWFWSVKDCVAWFTTALATELHRATTGEAKTKRRIHVSKARRIYARAHARKPRCELGGFFSAERVNLRNAP